MAKHRAAVAVVPVVMALPIVDTSIKQTICNGRSFVFAKVQVTQMDTAYVTNYARTAFALTPYATWNSQAQQESIRYLPKQEQSIKANGCNSTIA